jgi:tripartite-type tricarboxylate transporter receptor subunit TctC
MTHALRATVVALLALCALAALPARADYPEQAIKLVLPFPPGGETDPLARVVGGALAKSLGQPVVIENRPGASGNIAFDSVARAPKDGYTLLMGFSYPLVVNPILYKNLSYSAERDLVPIALLAEGQFVLVVNAALPVKSVSELVDYARAHPGKLTFASAGVGSPLHLAGELFMARTGVRMLHVPYKGGGDAARAILAGEADVLFGSPSGSLGNIRAGKVTALAVTGPKRLSFLPELPTMEEAGLQGFVVTAWHSLLAPAGTPQPVLDRLQREVTRALATPEVREQADKQGLVILQSTPAAVRERVRTETALWTKVINDAGIRAE